MTVAMNERPADLDRALEAAVEGEIREFLRRDRSDLGRLPDIDSDGLGSNITVLLDRVAGTSVRDIDWLVSELQGLRATLQEQGARVRRDLAKYAHVSQSTMQSTNLIVESLAQWRKTGGSSPDTASH